MFLIDDMNNWNISESFLNELNLAALTFGDNSVDTAKQGDGLVSTWNFSILHITWIVGNPQCNAGMCRRAVRAKQTIGFQCGSESASSLPGLLVFIYICV